MVIAKWTGCFPCLCQGEWKLFIDGQDVSFLIPWDRRTGPMYTAGTYQEWHFEDWQEVFEDYEDGLEFEEWLTDNAWVRDIPAPSLDIYLAFQSEDWRHNSCGGCI